MLAYTVLFDLLQVYISLHAYSQAWLLPSTHTQATFADDGMLLDMGKLATAALADVYGTKYQAIYFIIIEYLQFRHLLLYNSYIYIYTEYYF